LHKAQKFVRILCDLVDFLMNEFFSDLVAWSPGTPDMGVKFLIAAAIPAILFAAFLIAPKIRRSTNNKALKKVLARSRMGLLGFSITLFLYLWMRLEAVPMLSMRLWYWLILLGLLIWLIWKITLYRKIRHRIVRAEERRKAGK
jgi:Ca2+/Na+ antiporter